MQYIVSKYVRSWCIYIDVYSEYACLSPVKPLCVVPTVYFDQETYIVNETKGIVETKLILSKPVPQAITVYITAQDGSAKGM